MTAYEPEGFATWQDVATTSAMKEVALRKAARWLDTVFSLRWQGTKLNSTMALDWPRRGVISEGFTVPSDAVPQQVKDAQVEAAVRFLSRELEPDVAKPGRISKERKHLEGLQIEREYVGGASQVKSFTVAESILCPLLVAGNRLRLS
ncbi:MAG: hypothetical protein GY716_15695 [bacterium]|nr:hypothetical protein [bacterium]